MLSFSFLILLLTSIYSDASVHRFRRGAYMASSSYSRPSYGDQWNNQNSYNPYQNWNQNQNQNSWGENQYQNRGGQYGSSYGRPSSYGPPQPSYGPPKSPYGRPEPTYSPYSRPTSSYGRPPQFYPPPPAPPVPSVVPSVDPPVINQPIVPPSPVAPEVPPVAPPVPVPAPGPVPPIDFTPTTSGPLFGGVEPGAGALSPGDVPPPPPTDEEMTRVDAAEKENEVRKARGGPPGINVDEIAKTGTLPPQAAIPDIPMPPV